MAIAVCLGIGYGHRGRVEWLWQLQQRTYGPQSEKYLLSGPLQQTLCQPLAYASESCVWNSTLHSSASTIGHLACSLSGAMEAQAQMGTVTSATAALCTVSLSKKTRNKYTEKIRRRAMCTFDLLLLWQTGCLNYHKQDIKRTLSEKEEECSLREDEHSKQKQPAWVEAGGGWGKYDERPRDIMK